MDFGLEFSRIFAADEDGKRKKAMMNRHNSAAGRKVTSFNRVNPLFTIGPVQFTFKWFDLAFFVSNQILKGHYV